MIGPVFSREALTAPRRPWFYAVRSLFVVALLALVLTAWQVLVGSQNLAGPGGLSRFGASVFALLAPLQLTLAVLFSALLSAAAVSQEKDRKTLEILLLSDLRNHELVLGKLLASMLTVLLAVASTVPLFLLFTLWGGVSAEQVARVAGVTLASALAAGSLGSTFALWREKTFQALALTGLTLVLWLVCWEAVAAGALGPKIWGIEAPRLATWMSPWRAVLAALEPGYGDAPAELAAFQAWKPRAGAATPFLLAMVGVIAALNGLAIGRVRVWNPSREARAPDPSSGADDPWRQQQPVDASDRHAAHRAPGRVRAVWDNPILWREVRTWAYGRKVLVVKGAYLAIFALCAVAAWSAATASADPAAQRATVHPAAAPLAPLFVLSIVIINALSVTSITSERDLKALDLLLATDLSPSEIVFGKLGGAAWNAKEMIVLPLALCGALYAQGTLNGENLFFLAGGLLVMDLFAAVLGLHAGMTYPNSRHAIATSIGTLLFLFLGVTTCMRMMLALSESFQHQLGPFLACMFGGGAGLYLALGWRNRSVALGWASFLAPFTVFYALVSFLTGKHDMAFGATGLAFGFATAAMLVPALSEFDVATGRTSARDLP